MKNDKTQKLLFHFWKTTEEQDQKRLAGQTPPDGVEEVVNLAYIDDGDPMHLLDIYYPRGTNAALPVIVDIHGGGWMYGTKELNKNYCLTLASMGFAVVNLSYRLCPQTTIPGQIQDIFAAYRWLDGNGADYFCDLDNVFVTGDSAGGHLAALSCAIMGRDGLDEIFDVTLPRLRFNAAGFTCGGFDPLKILNKPTRLTRAYKEILLGENCDAYPYASYLNVSALVGGTHFPPIYMVSSKEDFVLSMSVAFSRKLSEYAVPHRFRKWGIVKGKHLTHVFNVLYPEWTESKKTNEEMLSLFREYTK
ncbi:MAG: alpha/beta hydrolase [Oscillospiraceae bacterium]|jgi:acetyl esterase/lipase|nr:alpha/beta hydrolase [Oscillospiraceae bacterium]